MIGMNIIVSEHALEDNDQRNFPASRHRSARVHKKLVKRHGGEFRKVGCAYKIGGKIVMHPNVYAQLQERMAAKLKASAENLFYGSPYLNMENHNVVL
jgi:hypothetical protein